jgi:asparagine synthase (glutamine-hydrolysing)
MCGIAGYFVAQPADLGPIGRRLLQRLEHRGPDDGGWMSTLGNETRYGSANELRSARANAILLHRRLSILDLSSAGRQPMASNCGRYSVVFNGEIYNYLELRDELKSVGRRFRTGTDTEVLLAAYAEWGLEAIPRFRGMFGFALLDLREQKCVLARDHFGIKPLFYTVTPRGFAFASEIKALLEIPGVSRKLDAQSVFWYLDSGLTDDQPESMIKGIRRLPAAHYAVLNLRDLEQLSAGDNSSFELTQYWNVAQPTRTDCSFDEAKQHLRDLFLNSIQLHLRSDADVGTALSGGIDSSSIVMATQRLWESKHRQHSFSFVADDEKVSEEKWVDIVAKSSGTQLHKIRIASDELTRDIDDLIYAQDEPFSSTSVYAQYRIFRKVRQEGVKVMLDGQGADEIMAGYKSFMNLRLQEMLDAGQMSRAVQFYARAMRGHNVGGYDAITRKLKKYFPPALHGMLGSLRRFGHVCANFSFSNKSAPQVGNGPVRQWMNQEWFVKHGAIPPTWRIPTFGGGLRGKLLECVQYTSLPMLLRFEDRNSMAHGVESRVPFLTPEIVSFALSMPDDYLLNDRGVGKHVFRESMRGITPDAILDRRDKIGFATPEEDWLREVQPWAESVINSPTARDLPLFNYSEMASEWRDTVEGKKAFHPRIWRWLNLIRWIDIFGVDVSD